MMDSDTHVLNPAWPTGITLCGRQVRADELVTVNPTCKLRFARWVPCKEVNKLFGNAFHVLHLTFPHYGYVPTFLLEQ